MPRQPGTERNRARAEQVELARLFRLERESAIIPGTGDSLAITSRISFAATNDTTKVPGGTLMIGAIRLMEQARLDMLKARLEGRPAPGAPATP